MFGLIEAGRLVALIKTGNALRCASHAVVLLMETKEVTYFALNSLQREMGLPGSTSMPPFPGLSDITTLSSTGCSLTRESLFRYIPANEIFIGAKNIFKKRQ